MLSKDLVGATSVSGASHALVMALAVGLGTGGSIASSRTCSGVVCATVASSCPSGSVVCAAIASSVVGTTGRIVASGVSGASGARHTLVMTLAVGFGASGSTSCSASSRSSSVGIALAVAATTAIASSGCTTVTRASSSSHALMMRLRLGLGGRLTDKDVCGSSGLNGVDHAAGQSSEAACMALLNGGIGWCGDGGTLDQGGGGRKGDGKGLEVEVHFVDVGSSEKPVVVDFEFEGLAEVG
jgi:hypothetical protein